MKIKIISIVTLLVFACPNLCFGEVCSALAVKAAAESKEAKIAALAELLDDNPAGASSEMLSMIQGEQDERVKSSIAAQAIKACDRYAFSQKTQGRAIDKDFFNNHMEMGWIMLIYLLRNPEEARYDETYLPLLFVLYSALGHDLTESRVAIYSDDWNKLNVSLQWMAVYMSRHHVINNRGFRPDDWESIVLPVLAYPGNPQNVWDDRAELALDMENTTHHQMLLAAMEPIYQFIENLLYYVSWYGEIGSHFPTLVKRGLHSNYLTNIFTYITNPLAVSGEERIRMRQQVMGLYHSILGCFLDNNPERALGYLQRAADLCRDKLNTPEDTDWLKAKVFERLQPFFGLYPEMETLLSIMQGGVGEPQEAPDPRTFTTSV